MKQALDWENGSGTRRESKRGNFNMGTIYTKYARDPYSSKYSPAKLTLCIHIFLEKYINFQETFI